MTRRRTLIAFVVLLCLAALLGLAAIWGTVEVTAPMLSIPVVVTRNGQEVPAEQIRSVRYLIDVNPPKSPEEIDEASLRDAQHLAENFYLIAAPFSIYRSGLVFHATEVKPEFRSVFLRITFTDGKVLSFSFPVVSDTRENRPMHVDIGDAPH